MAFDISLTAGMRADLTSLQGTAMLLNRTQQRLSTGKSVNSATDDPSAYFAAQDHTAHASDLAARKSQMGEAIQAVNSANQGITSITALINQAQGLVQSAQSADSTTRATLAAQFNTIRTQIDQLASDSGYNGKNFLNGDTLNVLFNETGSSLLTVTGFSGNSAGLGITGAATATGTSYTNDAVAASGSATTGAVVSFGHLGVVSLSSVVLSANISVAGEQDGTAGAAGATGSVFQLTAGGATFNASATNISVSLTGTALTAADFVAKLSGGSMWITLQSGSDLGSMSAAHITASYSYSQAVTAGQYTVAAGSDSTAGTITFNTAVTGAVTANYSVDQTLWGSSGALTADASNLNAANSTLRAQASTLAANLSVITTRQTWSQGMITTLQTGADNLTLADMNEEGANMLALQTRQQLGIQALSLASQANQSIMRLFG